MQDKYFIIGVGGTGMRCIEAFTHLCAIGMFDNKEIDILSIDTDTDNGNKGRSEQLIDRYIRIKGGAEGKPTANTFFTAKLNIYKFCPQYSGDRSTYELISYTPGESEDTKKDNKTLSDLFFDDDVQKFKLDHGYRAQTHLGSHLMYHCIIEAAKNVRDGKANGQERELADFLDKINLAAENARVFVLGSIFGGTGASSIPIIPEALRAAIKIKDIGSDIKNAKFGCSLLSEYFEFTSPIGADIKEQKIIADWKNFSLNSQAALMFYQADATVKATYKLMYHIGWPKRANFSQGDTSKKTITGGGEQENPCHISELFCAAAAYDFFNRVDGLDDQHDIVFKSANFQNDSFLFEFQDFLGEDKAKEFMNKLGAFLALSHIIINAEKGGFGQKGAENLVKKFKEFNIPDYINLEVDEAKDIDEFVKAFAFNYDTKGNVISGWLFQIRQSVDGDFLFQTDAFSTNQKQLKDFHFGKLFKDEAYQFAKKGKYVGSGDPYSAFRDTIQTDANVKPSPEKQKVERLNERFLAHTYNTLTKLFKIINN